MRACSLTPIGSFIILNLMNAIPHSLRHISERNTMNKPLTHVSEPTASVLSPSHCTTHPTGSMMTEPTHATIATRAYDIYQKSGRKQGQCKQNWQQAEKSLHDQCQCGKKA